MDAGLHRLLQLRMEEQRTMMDKSSGRNRSMGLIGRLGVGRSTTVAMELGVGSDSGRRGRGVFYFVSDW